LAADVAVHPFRAGVPRGEEGDTGQYPELGHQDEPIGQKEPEGARKERNQIARAPSAPMFSQDAAAVMDRLLG
jgi:hypothetical protein